MRVTFEAGNLLITTNKPKFYQIVNHSQTYLIDFLILYASEIQTWTTSPKELL